MAEKKKRNQLMVLGALVVTGAMLFWYEFAIPSAAIRSIAATTNYTPINAQDFSPVFGKLKDAESTEYKSTGRNIFIPSAAPAAQQAIAATIAKPKPQRGTTGPTIAQATLPPPPPAVLNMKFFGYGNLPSGGPRTAFLQDGEEVRIVKEGETLQGHIRITRIGNDRIEFEDTSTGQRGFNALEVTPAV
jgi:hypothetical protein